MKLQLCIVGCGNYARTVLGMLGDVSEDFDFYFASRDAQKAKAYCEAFGGIDYFGSYEEAAADTRIEAMYFLTPHDLHLPNAQLAARHSKHILMEKPIARSIPEAMALIDAATEGGVRLMVAENYRFLPGVARCKELIREGAIGQIRILQLESTYHMYSTYDTVGPDPWRLNAERCGGGTFIDAGIHCVDLLINIGGFPETVYASKPIRVLPEIEGEDSLVLMTRLPNGVIGTMIFSSARPVSEWKRQMLVTGTTGEIRFDQMNSEIHVAAGETSHVESVPTDQQAYRIMFREFKGSVAEDRESLMSGQEAINDLAVVLAAYESADTGMQVPVQMHPIDCAAPAHT